MSAPAPVRRIAPETFDWRTDPAADAVRRVLAAAAETDGRSALNEAAILTLRNHGLDTGLMLLDEDERGFAYVHGLLGGGRPELDLVVTPEARGAGVGRSLAEAALESLAGIPITAWSHGNHPAAARLADRLGFASVRELWLMRRPAEPMTGAGGAGSEGGAPAGVQLRAFRIGTDEDGLLRVNAAAFADHPEQGQLDRRGLADRLAEDWFDAAGLLVAVRDDKVVGFHWTKVHDEQTGEVYVIGVDPAEQGSGLGKVLLAAGLDHLAARGLSEVILYVEADNTTATRMYAANGFTHADADTDVMYAPAP